MTVKNKLDQLSTVIAEEAMLTAEIEHMQRRLDRNRLLRTECEELIDGTANEDVILHRVLILHCIQGLTWVQVAAKMPGGGTPGAYRQMYNRWLKSIGGI